VICRQFLGFRGDTILGHKLSLDMKQTCPWIRKMEAVAVKVTHVSIEVDS
jgi:hypothetical protein